ncbi:MAG: isoamylase early set domain-containing protein [Desulfobacterales bacterium]
MSIKKQFLKSKPICKVTFRLPAEMAPEARTVHLVTELNDWDREALPLKRLKNGDFTLTLDLQTDREVQFRYLVDGQRWENDPEADTQTPTCFEDTCNSVITTF